MSLTTSMVAFITPKGAKLFEKFHKFSVIIFGFDSIIVRLHNCFHFRQLHIISMCSSGIAFEIKYTHAFRKLMIVYDRDQSDHGASNYGETKIFQIFFRFTDDLQV